MKLKNSSIFLFTIASLFGSSVLAAPPSFESSSINFNGKIYSATCKITVENNGKIEFDDYFSNDFSIKGSYPTDKKKNFKLNVSDCDLRNKLSIKFDVKADSSDSQLIAIDSSSEASGVGIAIEDESDKLVKLNDDKSNVISVNAGKAELNYKAYLKQNSDAKVKAGELTATAKVTVIAS